MSRATRHRYVRREFRHPCWSLDHAGGCSFEAGVVETFERRMKVLATHRKGAPALVLAWDDGRGETPWYEARAGHAERLLRDEMAALFGVPPAPESQRP